MSHERFRFRSLDELLTRVKELGLDIPAQEDVSILARPVPIGDGRAPNALAIHAMEGCDGAADGRPDALTIRRYERFARGGAGMLWSATPTSTATLTATATSTAAWTPTPTHTTQPGALTPTALCAYGLHLPLVMHSR